MINNWKIGQNWVLAKSILSIFDFETRLEFQNIESSHFSSCQILQQLEAKLGTLCIWRAQSTPTVIYVNLSAKIEWVQIPTALI